MRKRTAAIWAAFLLLVTILFAPIVRLHGSSVYTTVMGQWLYNSKVDATPIGQTSAAAGAFTALTANSAYVNGSSNHGGPSSVNASTSQLMSSFYPALSGQRADVDVWIGEDNTGGNNGVIQSTHTNGTAVYALLIQPYGGTTNFGSGTVTIPSLSSSAISGPLTGNVTGNASTASALAASPTNCSSPNYARGVNASGTANCAQPAASEISGLTTLIGAAGIQRLNNYGLCTPSTSTDAQCTGTVSFTGYSDANWGVNYSITESTGAQLSLVVTSKSSTSFAYALTCTFFCGSIAAPTGDFTIWHP
ncbi:hypothetical protein DYQ86_15975 [Acidobacteria bacterium AB60]|nr:hypothetical protein DYQ86_15975 [Acidobacteria bacterium AB60]